MTVESVVAWVAVACFATTGCFALLRVLKGPTVLDRIIASDVFLITVVMVLVLDMIVHKHDNSIALMIAIAATGALATITVARFVRKRPQESANSDTNWSQTPRESGEGE